MAFQFPYQQQYGYMEKLVKACKKKGFAKETTTALAVNAYHESYLNPYVIEGAINPGPPLGGNGWDDGHSGGGLWQWTPFAGKIKLGDFDGQVDYMESDVGQWNIYGTWFSQAGLADPTPKIESFNDFLHNTKSYDDTALTRAFIGYWERPAYGPGTTRYNNASSEAPQFRELVDQYWGSGGGNPSNGSPGGGGSDGGTKPSENTNNSKIGLTDEIKNLIAKFTKAYEDALQKDIKLSTNSKYHFNSKVKMTPLYPDTYRIKMTSAFEDALKKLIETSKINSNTRPSQDDTGDETNSKPKPDDSGNTSNQAIYDGIINWCKVNKGKTYNYIQDHPSTQQPQCVDMIKALNDHYINNDKLRSAMAPGNGNAQDIFKADISGSGWKRVNGDIANDANATKIWNGLPNGCIVYYQYSTYGHVAIKAGDADLAYQQNYNGQGFISLDNDLAFRTYTGAGFLGAWVLE